ncbi:MAG: alanine--tRNA ligase [Candidatus Woesearchaeota archaeon]|nr:MAG: alanine--tRNA ligase [Candidatus Woesearchaeota archaeon]
MLLTDKEQKKAFLKEASTNFEKYYPVGILHKEGFMRKQCPITKLFFWTVNKDQEVCGDSKALGKVTMLEKRFTTKKQSYPEVWKNFETFFTKLGYTSMNRYPVVARWNPTTEFTIASIAAFQPYVVSGAMEPPAKKLVIPQFCLRFGDVDNVGVTGSHMTGFTMIGQHAFMPASEWNQELFFSHMLRYVLDIVGLDKKDITIHEDAWAGGGNFGPCMEFFSGGVELFNQVYMLYEQTPTGPRELKQKVLDMGLGMERVAWFSQGTPTIYEATFPQTIKFVLSETNILPDYELFKRFAVYATLLNSDETDDISAVWHTIASHLGVHADRLQETISPLTKAYALTEHVRALLFALADGKLPSNVGGGYNLRMIYRRARDFAHDLAPHLDLYTVATHHADELLPVYPEIKEALPEIKHIFAHEEMKWKENKDRTRSVLAKLSPDDLDVETLVSLYDEKGISPDMIKEHFPAFHIPETFFAKLAQRHETKEQATATKKERTIPGIEELPETEILYWGRADLVSFEATVLAVVDKEYVVLDKSAFYPTSGGQLHDLGTVHGEEVLDVFKVGNIIVHKLKNTKLEKGAIVTGEIDLDRRMQLAIHHTATHLLTGSCKRVLGRHVWQAGAAKTLEKARLDITHFDIPTKEELDKIESVANAAIQENLVVKKTVMPRALAENKYGFELYQGGAVPGKNLRIVEIVGFDVEACGGTHLDTTGFIKKLTISKATKVQDGVIRIEFVAGPAAESFSAGQDSVLDELAALLSCSQDQIVGRATELFTKWKQFKKGKLDKVILESDEKVTQNVLEEVCKVLRTQENHVVSTVTRFLRDVKLR